MMSGGGGEIELIYLYIQYITTVLCREVFFFVLLFVKFYITFFLQVVWCCTFLESQDKCLIHILGTYCMFLGPLGVILRLRK